MNKAIENIQNEVLSDRLITEFCKKNQIDEVTMSMNLPLLYQQKQANDICHACLGKKPCAMDVENMQSELQFHHGNIERVYKPCPYLDHLNDAFVEMLFIPEAINIGEYHLKEERKKVYTEIKQFVKNVNKEKGLYIHGPFGTGKTFILMRMAKELAKKNHKIIFAYYPDLVRHIKQLISTNGVEAMVQKLKKIEILILDDVGGETNSAFIRDEILTPILQYRMEAKKPVFMTSNFNFDELRTHFMETRDEKDMVKSDRIMERIRFMMRDIELLGPNMRK